MPIDAALPHIASSLVSLRKFGGNVDGSFAPLVIDVPISASGDLIVPLLAASGVAPAFGCGPYGSIVRNH